MTHRASKVGQHFLQHMIRADQDRRLGDLGRNVPVAEVPSQTQEQERVRGGDLDQWFGRGLDRDPLAFRGRQSVTVGHGDRPLQVQQRLASIVESKTDPAAMARVEVQGHRAFRVGDRPMPVRAVNFEPKHQNKKYRWAMDSTSAGSQVKSRPSARTS